ncbi:MAG: hypothetical protein M3347_06110 [Armatimonadota bacterium]|nr:hypothetical protein [Armatimonadota bacterium]
MPHTLETRRELEAQLDAAYELLADDLETDAEPFFAAQREVVESEARSMAALP